MYGHVYLHVRAWWGGGACQKKARIPVVGVSTFGGSGSGSGWVQKSSFAGSTLVLITSSIPSKELIADAIPCCPVAFFFVTTTTSGGGVLLANASQATEITGGDVEDRCMGGGGVRGVAEVDVGEGG